MKRTLKLISAILLAAMLAAPVSALTYPAYVMGEYLAEESKRLKDQPAEQHYTLTYYKDAEMTEAYGDIAEIPADSYVYYDIVLDDGYYIKWIRADADYMDGEKILFGRHTPASVKVNCVLTGDINSDYAVNLSDVTTLLKFMSVDSYDYSEQMIAADFSDDGKFNLADIVILMKRIAKWDVGLSAKSEGEYEIYCQMDTSKTNRFTTDRKYYDPGFYNTAVIKSTEELEDYIKLNLDLYGIITSEKMDDGFYAEDVKAEFDEEFFAENELVVICFSDITATGDLFAENANGKLRIVAEAYLQNGVPDSSTVYQKFITVPKNIGIDLDSGIEMYYRYENSVGARYLKRFFDEEIAGELLNASGR